MTVSKKYLNDLLEFVVADVNDTNSDAVNICDSLKTSFESFETFRSDKEIALKAPDIYEMQKTGMKEVIQIKCKELKEHISAKEEFQILTDSFIKSL